MTLLHQWKATIEVYEEGLRKEIERKGLTCPDQRQVLFDTDAGRQKLRQIHAEIERRAIPIRAEVFEGEPEATWIAPLEAACH